MSVFLAIFIMMTIGSVAILMIVRAHKSNKKVDDKTRIVIVDLLAANLVVLCDLLWGGSSFALHLPLDILTSFLPLFLITSSIWKEQISINLSRYLSIPVWGLMIYYIFHGLGLIRLLSHLYFISVAVINLMVICLIFILSVSLRMREIRQVMRNGNVWSSICLTIDIVYLIFPILYVLVMLISVLILKSYVEAVSMVISFLIAGELAALGLRVSYDTLFVVWSKHERHIVESMKISQIDVTQDTTKINDLYKEIYARIVALFETEKPYLNSELTINDIVKVIYTNKLYISRSISKFTGKNFCQFVNYYRVLHSIQLFRENPDLKVNEMATRSGFNSTVSFSMAFRLYMNECPSDWCRKEKFKIIRRIK